MNLREKVEKLLDAPTPRDEREMLQFVLETNDNEELEGMLFPDVETYINGRFEWFYLPNGILRRKLT